MKTSNRTKDSETIVLSEDARGETTLVLGEVSVSLVKNADGSVWAHIARVKAGNSENPATVPLVPLAVDARIDREGEHAGPHEIRDLMSVYHIAVKFV